MGGDDLRIRVQTLEEAMQLLVQIARRHDTRFDELTATMDNLGGRVTAMVDAQIRTEDALAELRQSQSELARETAEWFKETNERFRETDGKFRELAESQRQTGEAMKELAESQRRTDVRLNALIDTISRSRDSNEPPA